MAEPGRQDEEGKKPVEGQPPDPPPTPLPGPGYLGFGPISSSDISDLGTPPPAPLPVPPATRAGPPYQGFAGVSQAAISELGAVTGFPQPFGGAVCGGAATVAQIQTIIVATSGGSVCGGVATLALIPFIPSSGGAVCGSTADVAFISAGTHLIPIQAVGGSVAGGAADAVRLSSTTAPSFGGVVCGGMSDVSVITAGTTLVQIAATGGAVAGGTSDVQATFFAPPSSGGVVVGGLADANQLEFIPPAPAPMQQVATEFPETRGDEIEPAPFVTLPTRPPVVVGVGSSYGGTPRVQGYGTVTHPLPEPVDPDPVRSTSFEVRLGRFGCTGQGSITVAAEGVVSCRAFVQGQGRQVVYGKGEACAHLHARVQGHGEVIRIHGSGRCGPKIALRVRGKGRLNHSLARRLERQEEMLLEALLR